MLIINLAYQYAGFYSGVLVRKLLQLRTSMLVMRLLPYYYASNYSGVRTAY
jgi:hypothetical protein